MPLFSPALLLQQIKLDSKLLMQWPTRYALQKLQSMLAAAQPGYLPTQRAQISWAHQSLFRHLRVNCLRDPLRAPKICTWLAARLLTQALISIPQPHKIKPCSQLRCRNIAQLATLDSRRGRLWHFWHKLLSIQFLKTFRIRRRLVRP